MFGSIGMTELLTLLLLVLILFGPKRIPELARSLGKSLNELKRAAEDVKQELELDDFDKPNKLKKPETKNVS
ncbi:MAG: twin-arginine translocase TatA/TatE family subunit [bacterium]